ncbi:type II toxin-antitoxin system RelE/ParE family toxin [Flavobacterium sp.]|uniref:type II toxin-antitoxin system RelE/ParE family toxin n=1 Tax=Flavobacterium sp. TaxID=239 RepID=UPI00391C4214
MIYKLKIFPKAKSDLSEISSWYEDIQKGLGKRFLKNVSLEMKVVKSNPISFQIRYDTTRVVLIKKFPYLIHYEIIDNEILIKAVIHTSRDTKNWKNKTDY